MNDLDKAEEEEGGGAALVEYVEEVEAPRGAHGQPQQEEQRARSDHYFHPMPEPVHTISEPSSAQ